MRLPVLKDSIAGDCELEPGFSKFMAVGIICCQLNHVGGLCGKTNMSQMCKPSVGSAWAEAHQHCSTSHMPTV